MIQNIRKPIGYHAIQTSSAKVLKAMRELKTSLFPGHGARLNVSFVFMSHLLLQTVVITSRYD